MQKKKLVLTIVLIAAFSLFLLTPVFAQKNNQNEQTLTLEELQELAVENSRSMEKLDLMIEQADRQVRILKNDLSNLRYGRSVQVYDSIQATRQLLGALQLQRQAITKNPDYSDAQKELLLSGVDAQIANANNTIMSLQQSQMSLGSAQKQLQQALDGAEDAQKDVERLKVEAELRLKNGVAEQVFSIFQTEDSIKYLEKSYNYILKLTEIERLKKDLGMTNTVVIDQFAVQASDLGKQLQRLQETYEVLFRQINDMIGKDPGTPLQIERVPVPNGARPAPSYSEISELVFDNAYNLYKIDREIERLEDELDDTDGSHEQLIVRADIRKKELEKTDAKIGIENSLKNLLADYNEKSKALQLAQISLNTARQNYQWNKIKEELGIMSPMDLMESELQYVKAKNDLTKAGFDYQLVSNKLELAKEGIF